MRLVVAACAACAACSFEAGRLATTDDAQSDTSSSDDARVDALALCASPKEWRATFDVDPTQLDGNGDATNDWSMRDQGTVPGTLSNGVWAAPGLPIRPLDGQPKQDFATRTRVDVRLRNTVRAATFGAVLWINVDYEQASFAPLYLVVQLSVDSTAQEVTLYGKTDNATSIVLHQTSVAGTGFIDVTLDIEPAQNQVTSTVGTQAPVIQTYPTIARNGNDDRWPTVLAWNGDSEFDDVRVTVCP